MGSSHPPGCGKAESDGKVYDVGNSTVPAVNVLAFVCENNYESPLYDKLEYSSYIGRCISTIEPFEFFVADGGMYLLSRRGRSDGKCHLVESRARLHPYCRVLRDRHFVESTDAYHVCECG